MGESRSGFFRLCRFGVENKSGCNALERTGGQNQTKNKIPQTPKLQMMSDIFSFSFFFVIVFFFFFLRKLITLIHLPIHSLCLPLLSLTRSVFCQMSISGPPQFFLYILKSLWHPLEGVYPHLLSG